MRTLSSFSILIAMIAVTQDAKPRVTRISSASITPVRIDLAAIEKKLELAFEKSRALEILTRSARQLPAGKKLPRCTAAAVRIVEGAKDSVDADFAIGTNDTLSEEFVKKFNLRCAPSSVSVRQGQITITESTK